MMEFHSERQPPRPPQRRGRSGAWFAAVCVIGLIATAGVWAWRSNIYAAYAGARTGSLRIESEPAGAAVDIDGSPRGLTPLTLELAPGAHAVTVRHGERTEQIAATVTAGALNTHHLRWSRSERSEKSETSERVEVAGRSARGHLDVFSEPAGGTVTIDGVMRGVSPVSVENLEPGEHQVVVQLLGRTHRRTVTVEPGATASLRLSNAPVGNASGWLTTRTGASLQILEKGRLLGSTDTDRILLPVGNHELQFVADALGFRARRTVTISAGQTTTVTMSLPQAAVNLNAVPWADVTIDGKNMGQTPIANLMVTIGTHQVTFRHPEFGERTTTVTVSLKEPARVAVDMRTR